MIHVGWDWASRSHEVTVIDQTGRVIDRWSLAHTETAIGDTIRRLSRHGQPASVEVAIEASNGLIVDRLLEAGHPVVPDPPQRF